MTFLYKNNLWVMKSQRFDFVQGAKHNWNYYNILVLELDIIN